MVATPAGSTAYNLSAQGPILPLDAPLLALTPVSPFRPRRWRGALLSNRATVRFDILEAGQAAGQRGRRPHRGQGGRLRDGARIADGDGDAAVRPQPFLERAHPGRAVPLLSRPWMAWRLTLSAKVSAPHSRTLPAFKLTKRGTGAYRIAQSCRRVAPAAANPPRPGTSQKQPNNLSSDTTTAQEALTFADLGLSPKVLSAVTDAGYTVPTPIQAGAIPHALQGKDVLGIAQTGTGKTAAFVLPMITRLEKGRARARMPRTLILEPTRELAAQVEENFIKYGKNHKLNIALLIGGVSFDEQDTKLERGADVLIATPGRLLDHRERGKLLLNGVEILVIDEADRMLDMGFIPDIERICEMIPFTRQTLFFSATMPPEITKLTEKFLHAPVRVEVSRAASTGDQRSPSGWSSPAPSRGTSARCCAT